MSEHKKETYKQNLIGRIQTILITNGAGVETKANMLITGVDGNGKLKWTRPCPYVDCQSCGYGPYGCNCSTGFIQ